jgi:hypothetical protein
MNYLPGIIRTLPLLLALMSLLACSSDANLSAASQPANEAVSALEVYKSPSCGCCNDWVEHVEKANFPVTTQHPDDMNRIKADHGIARQYQSCHTAVSARGFVFEGHVPAKLMKQFLDNPPADAIGLAVPGMPMGSPGMEMGDQFTPYQVLLLKADGSSEVYATMNTRQEQY